MMTDIFVEIKLNGSIVTDQFHSITISNKLFDHCEMVIELGIDAHDSEDKISDTLNKWLGSEVEIAIKDFGNTNLNKSYKGVIVNFSASDTHIFLKGLSKDFKLNTAKKYKSFENIDINSLVKSIAGEVGVNLNFHAPSHSKEFEYIQQYNETDYEFIMRLAAYDGCILFNDGNNLAYSPKINVGDTIKLGLEEIDDIKVECNIKNVKWRGMPYNFTKHEDPSSLEVLSTSLSPGNNQFAKKAYNTSKSEVTSTEDFFNQTIIDKSDFTKYISHKQNYEFGEMVEYSGVTFNPMVAVGSLIDCANHPILKEKVAVYELKITFFENTYKAQFKAKLPDSIIEPPHTINSKLEKTILEPAIVVDNVDPDSLGRVKIQYMWNKSGLTPWARIVHMGAGQTGNGKGYGTHYIPRVGDQVQVACEHGDSSLPIIIGALYHSQSKPDFITNNGTEEVLVLKTPQETEIRAIDTGGSEEIYIQTRGSRNIIRILHNIPSILIESLAGNIMVNAKNITLKADELLRMECKTMEIVVDENSSTDIGKDAKVTVGNNSELTASKDVKMAAGANMKHEASQNIDLVGGMNNTVKGGTKVEVQGGAQVKVSGPMIEAAASGIHTIKGSMVMIN